MREPAGCWLRDMRLNKEKMKPLPAIKSTGLTLTLRHASDEGSRSHQSRRLYVAAPHKVRRLL